MTCEWNWQAADRDLKRAVEIGPNDSETLAAYAGYLIAMGKVEESIAYYRRASQAEPLSPIYDTILARPMLYLRQHDQAAEELRRALELDPNFVEALVTLGWVYEQKGMFAEAITEIQKAVNASGGHPRMVGALGHAYAIAGQRKPAEQSLVRLKEQQKQRYVAPYDIAVVHAGLGETDQTFKYLELAIADHSHWMVWLRVDPRFDPIRDDPRYRNLLHRMNLTP